MTVIQAINTMWVVLAGAMVLFMEGGFSLLEAGLVRTKNSVNVTMKIFVDLTFGALAFFLIGKYLLFGHDTFHFFGIGRVISPATVPTSSFVLFQLGFAIATASIISGAVAERMKFSAYIVVVVLTTGLIYPLSGHWIWGNHGWLANLGLEDFAGSAAIHAMGGFMALALAIIVGPRKSRFNSDGSANVFAPSNIPLASAGAFILWFGWFGFNAGSTLSAMNSSLPTIALNTLLAAAAGGASAIGYSMYKFGVADPSMTINGSLAGLVAITAGCAYVTNYAAIIIGLVAGILVILATTWIDSLKIDDPVGAVSVHGVNGIFGTLAVGLFDTKSGLFTTGHIHLFAIQMLGAATVAIWGFAAAYGMGSAIRKLVGIRVSAEQEEDGIDLGSHGIPAYNELEKFSEAQIIMTSGELDFGSLSGVQPIATPIDSEY
jgi:ammonium transporter, Amt family